MKPKTTNISKAYANGVRALKNVTLTIPNGMHQLLKFNGAGKSMPMWHFLLITSMVVALVASKPAHAQDKTSKINKIFSWAKPTTPGCVSAVSQHGKLVVNRAYDLADLEREVPLTAFH